MRFLAIAQEFSETLFTITLEIAVMTLRNLLRDIYRGILGLKTECIAQITKLNWQIFTRLETFYRCFKRGKVLIRRFHACNMACRAGDFTPCQ